MTRRRLAALAVTGLLAVLATGCSDDGGTSGDAASDAGTATADAGAGGRAACAEAEVTDQGDGQAPEVTPVVGGAAPEGLVVEDLAEGDGAVAAAGDNITVNYIGIACSTGEVFDQSWGSGGPVEFPLVDGGLIDGWVQGIPGMKVGGRRVLVIPPELAYGPSGQGGVIGPNESLLFVIDLEAAS